MTSRDVNAGMQLAEGSWRRDKGINFLPEHIHVLITSLPVLTLKLDAISVR